MASSHYNSSTTTLVPPLGTPFNTILYFSDHLAYLPNTLQHLRQIHQRDFLSLRSLSSTIQPGQTALSVFGPSIIPVDNDFNWKNAPATNPTTNTITTNRLTFFTHSQSKLHQSNNTNEQLAKVLSQLANTLIFNQTPSPNINARGTKAHISDTFNSTKPNKLNNFLFQCCLYFCTNPVQFNTNIAKINFAMTYLTGVAQD